MHGIGYIAFGIGMLKIVRVTASCTQPESCLNTALMNKTLHS